MMSKIQILILVVLLSGLTAAGVEAYPQIKSYFVGQAMATPSAPHAVELTWNASPTITSYNIYRSAGRNGAYQKVGATAGPPFFDFPVPAPATLYYAVTAVNNKGESGYSDRAKASVP